MRPLSTSLSPPPSHSHFLPILEGSSYIHESDMGDRHFYFLSRIFYLQIWSYGKGMLFLRFLLSLQYLLVD